MHCPYVSPYPAQFPAFSPLLGWTETAVVPHICRVSKTPIKSLQNRLLLPHGLKTDNYTSKQVMKRYEKH